MAHSLSERLRRWHRGCGHDHDAHRELIARPPILPAGWDIEWLGTAGYRVSYQGTSLLIDPYLSRASLRSVIGGRALTSDPRQVSAALGDDLDVAGVVVGHTHFDHAVDAPALAERYRCRAFGSSSLAALMGVHGLADRAVACEPHRPYEIGPFRVTLIPSAHSKLIAGLAVPAAGELTCEHLDSLTGRSYRCGQVWGIRIEADGFSLYHQGSADFVESELPAGPVDVFLAGIAGRYASPGYVQAILGRLDPGVVIPGHYDDFFRPLNAPMGFSLNVNLAAFVDEVGVVAPGVTVAGLAHPSERPR